MKNAIRAGQRLPWLVLWGVMGAGAAASAPAAPPLLGFDAAGSEAELALEQQFDAALNPADLRTWLQDLSSEPNNVGSPHDRRNAETIRAMLASWGWNAHIETFDVLYPTPLKEMVELVAPEHHAVRLVESPVPGDPGSARGGLPAYNVYGADGDVTAQLVYVNYGNEDDYRELARRGVSVAGRIAIARYGGGWRGLKPKLAYEHGAVGCLIYSDPQQDGYGAGDTYPKGAWRPAQGIQRGSVADMPVYPGDPLTPGVGATPGARRLALKDARTLMKIPVLPIGYGDARVLLGAMTGPVAPPSWRGALPITYHLGPGAARVHLAVTSQWAQKPVYDVIATIRGSRFPDEWVVRGNHHDGWVEGAWDPLSGAVAQFEEAKSIGALLKTGWRPRRTLVYASWDGEEPGLLGSTEWAEQHAAELQAKAVLYLNSDENSRGFLDAGGSDSLQHFVNEVAAAVPDPETGVSVQARLRAREMAGAYQSSSAEARQQAQVAAAGGDLLLDALGSGSDFTPFLQHLGVTTLDLEYGGEDEQGGVYHSLYDTFDHYVRFGDPGFKYGIALARTNGRVVLRMADAAVLPISAGPFASRIAGYVQELHRLADERRRHALDLARLLDAHVFQLAADPEHPLAPPAPEAPVPFFNFAPLDNASAHLTQAAKAYDDAYAHFAAAGAPLPRERLEELNGLLRGLEQTLTSERGLPGRPWYRHLVYAPGLLTGYGAKTLPGVREGIEQGHWDDVNTYVVLTADALDAYADRLEKAAAVLGE